MPALNLATLCVASGCVHPVYRITKVLRSTKLHFDALRNEHFHVLRLNVVLPESPSDYMATANVFGDGIKFPINGHSFSYGHDRGHDHGQRRRLTFTADDVLSCPTVTIGRGSISVTNNAMHRHTQQTVKSMEDDTAEKAKLDAQKKPKEVPQTVAEIGKKLFDIEWCSGFRLEVMEKRGGPLSLGLSLNLHYGLEMEMRGEFIFKWAPFAEVGDMV